jgi:hypothetical protein
VLHVFVLKMWPHFGKYFVQPLQWFKEGLVQMRLGHLRPITWPKDFQHLEISLLSKWEFDFGLLGVPPFHFHILAFHVRNMISFFCIHFKSWFFIPYDSTCKKHLSSWEWHFVVHLESWSCTQVMVVTTLILVLTLVKGWFRGPIFGPKNQFFFYSSLSYKNLNFQTHVFNIVNWKTF